MAAGERNRNWQLCLYARHTLAESTLARLMRVGGATKAWRAVVACDSAGVRCGRGQARAVATVLYAARMLHATC
eukprot:scaffold26005_cov105-Isochrysis_galbana.AAC.1